MKHSPALLIVFEAEGKVVGVPKAPRSLGTGSWHFWFHDRNHPNSSQMVERRRMWAAKRSQERPVCVQSLMSSILRLFSVPKTTATVSFLVFPPIASPPHVKCFLLISRSCVMISYSLIRSCPHRVNIYILSQWMMNLMRSWFRCENSSVKHISSDLICLYQMDRISKVLRNRKKLMRELRRDLSDASSSPGSSAT